MKVYLVSSGEYSSYCVEAIYSTLEAAVEHVGGSGGCRVAEWEVKASADDFRGRFFPEPKALYVAAIDLNDGEVSLNVYTGELSGCVPDSRGLIVRSTEGAGYRTVTVGSPVSLQHAVKVAVERRQEWLRTQSLVGEPSA